MTTNKEALIVNESALRAAYSETAFARIGVPFERSMERKSVREVVEAAARSMVERELVMEAA